MTTLNEIMHETAGGFSPLAVANSMIEIAVPGGGIDHLRLQKELYIAHGIHLAAERGPLVRGGFKAWQYGPVSPDIYHAAKSHNAWRIVHPLSGDSIDSEHPPLAPDRAFARKLLKRVWESYSELSSFQLVELTHRQGTPWHIVTGGGKNVWGSRQIPDELIRSNRSGP